MTATVGGRSSVRLMAEGAVRVIAGRECARGQTRTRDGDVQKGVHIIDDGDARDAGVAPFRTVSSTATSRLRTMRPCDGLTTALPPWDRPCNLRAAPVLTRGVAVVPAEVVPAAVGVPVTDASEVATVYISLTERLLLWRWKRPQSKKRRWWVTAMDADTG